MDSGRIIKYGIQFLVLMALQVLLLKNLAIFNYAYCLAYVGAFLLLPFEVGTILAMFVGLGSGLLVDVFYDTLGIHAAACVLVAFMRNWLLKALTPAGGYEGYMEPTLPGMGLNWYLLYYAPLCFVHHLTLFLIEYADVTMIWLALLKALASTLFTLVVTVLVQNILVPR